MTPTSEPPQPFSPKRDVIESQVPEKGHQEIPQDDSGSQNPPANVAQAETELTHPKKAIGDSSKWIGWFSKSSTLAQDPPADESVSAIVEPSSNELSEQHSTMNLSKSSPVDSKQASGSEELPSSLSSGPVHPATTQTESRNWSWLGLWKDAATQPKSSITVTDVEPVKKASDSPTPQDPTNASKNITKLSTLDNSTAVQPSALSKSAGWAFWSKDRSQDESSRQTGNAGKLVLAEMPSQSRPDNDVMADAPKNMTKARKQERPLSTDLPNGIESTDLTKAQPLKGKTSSNAAVDSTIIKSTEKSDVRMKKDPTNLVLPAFKNTYKAVGKPSFIQQISWLLKYTQPPDVKHVNLLQEPARIRNALAIVR